MFILFLPLSLFEPQGESLLKCWAFSAGQVRISDFSWESRMSVLSAFQLSIKKISKINQTETKQRPCKADYSSMEGDKKETSRALIPLWVGCIWNSAVAAAQPRSQRQGQDPGRVQPPLGGRATSESRPRFFWKLSTAAPTWAPLRLTHLSSAFRWCGDLTQCSIRWSSLYQVSAAASAEILHESAFISQNPTHKGLTKTWLATFSLPCSPSCADHRLQHHQEP